VNCAGIPETLVESLLFGHKKGSFTGAIGDKQGFMSQAKDGTLFLDEIGELPLMSQAKFLRAIQERKITKLGGDIEEDISCRIVCATHRDLWDMVNKEQFRLDLFARLSTFEVGIIPLWRRPEDIPVILRSMEGGEELVKHFIENKMTPNHLHIKEMIPLNVRSLQQMVKRYKVLGELPE
jgi:transcriptional regulator with PAS, ATPase and Fis domain